MKKLKMDLNGIGELLSKEQMKMVTGGDSYSAGYVTCTYSIYGEGNFKITLGHNDIDLGIVRDCQYFCFSNTPSGTFYYSCEMFNVTSV